MKRKNRKLWLKISTVLILLALASANSVAPLTGAATAANAPDVTIEWAKVSPMLKPRHSGATVVVDGIIYTIGGMEGQFKLSKALEAYDPAADKWTTKAQLPHGRFNLAAAAYEGKIYTFGGLGRGKVVDTIDVYDIAIDTWAANIAKLPKPAVGMAAVTYGDKIYLFGGSASIDSFAPENYYHECYEFDPTTASFTSKSAMLPRIKTSAAVFKNRILVFGGLSASANRNAQLYDPTIHSWSPIEPVVTERLGWFGTIVNEMVFLMGGREHGGTSALVNIYSDQWQTWVTATNMMTPRENAFIAGVDGKLYVMGGQRCEKMQSALGTPLASVERGSPPPAPPTLDLTPPPSPPPPVTIEWSSCTPMPAPRFGGATAVVDNIIYTIGGIEVSESPTGKLVEAYDPVSDKWTSKSPLPSARANMAAAAYKGKIYIFGGGDAKLRVVDTVDVYDTATDTWEAEVATLPVPAVAMSAVTYQDKIYLFGGSRSLQMFVPSSYYYDKVYEFDPLTLTFTSKASMPVGRNMAFGCVLGDKIYIIGGMHSPGAVDNQAYDPGTNAWQKMVDLPEMRGGHSGAAMGDMAYIIGGTGEDDVSQYDPATNGWQEATPLETGRDTAFIGVASGSPESIYVIGGLDSKGNVLGSVEKGILSEGEPSPEPPPSPEPKPVPPSEPEPAPPREGMGCAKVGGSRSGRSLDSVPLLLGALMVSLAIASQRRKNK